MLVLSRKRDEAIIIDGRIKVIVVNIKDAQVQIGIEAPKDIPVHREEIWEQRRGEETR